MKYVLSKDFAKTIRKLSGKELRSVLAVLDEVESATTIEQIGNCKKLTGYSHVYRIRIGSRRAFFTFHVEIVEDKIVFRYLVSRGQAYDKAMEDKLRDVD